MKRLILLTIFLAINICYGYGQTIINTLDGKHIEVLQYIHGGDNYLYYVNMKGKTKIIEDENIFSIEKDGKVREYYSKDSICSFTYDQMASFLRGAEDGRKNYRPYGFAAGGFLVGAASPIAVSMVAMTAISPVIPIGYLLIVGSTSMKTKNLEIDSDLKNDTYYVTGYKATAHQKRVKRTLLWTGIALCAGLGGAIGIATSN